MDGQNASRKENSSNVKTIRNIIDTIIRCLFPWIQMKF